MIEPRSEGQTSGEVDGATSGKSMPESALARLLKEREKLLIDITVWHYTEKENN